MSEQQGHIAEALGKISKFFGWIAGILAGVSAMLSVAGFMLLKSHAHLLGLSGVFHHSVQDYLYQGGNFCISTLFWALPASIFSNTYIRILAVIIALYLLGRRIGLFTSIIQRLNASETFQQPWVRWVIILAAASLFILFINAILPPPKAQDLLFATSSHPEIAKRATPNAITALKNQYVFSILYVLISAILLWGINRIHRDPEKKSTSTFLYVCNWFTGIRSEQRSKETPQVDLFSALGRLFLYLLFLVQLVLLPVQYGKTVYPNTFHRVSNLILDEKLQGKIPQSQNIYLLNERSGEFVFYFGDTQEVSLVKKNSALNIALKSRENIFQ